MPEPTDEELGIPEGLDPNIRAELRKSRQRGQEAEAAKAEAEASKRELEFYKAGIPADGLGALIRKAYDGPLDADAIKTFAAAHGLTPEGTPAGGAPTNDQADRLLELENMRRMQQVTGTGGMPGTPELRADFIKAMKGAKTEAEAWALIEQRGPAVGVRRYIQGD